jgi:ligand-binding SRPBCC domain-containing protein
VTPESSTLARSSSPSNLPAEAPLPRGTFELTTRAFIPYPIVNVFAFFGDAANLDRLTPPQLRFRILTPLPIPMGVDTFIEYRIRLRGVPIRWRTHIAVWDPPYRFVDEQVRGPYRQWVHTHTFRPLAGGTLMDDRVRYRVPGGGVVNRLFVERELRTIFRYRLHALREAFSCEASPLDEDVRITRIG